MTTLMIMLILWGIPTILCLILFYIRFKIYDIEDFTKNAKLYDYFSELKIDDNGEYYLHPKKEIKPTIGTFWYYIQNDASWKDWTHSWWVIPIANWCVLIYSIFYIIFKPTIPLFKKIGKFIIDIKI